MKLSKLLNLVGLAVAIGRVVADAYKKIKGLVVKPKEEEELVEESDTQ